MKKFVVFCGLLAYQCLVVDGGYSFGNANSLESNLLNGYSRAYRPNITTNVFIQMGLMHMTELDIVAQELVVGGFLLVKWQDTRLKWSSVLYGNIESTHLFHSKIWTPPLLLSNAGNGIKLLNDDSNLASVVLQVESDGSVTWLYPVNFNAQCSVNIQYYPFDYQTCSMKISTWMYRSDQVWLDTLSNSINMDMYEENGEWTVHSTSCLQTSTLLYGFYEMSAIDCNMKLVRKQMYYVLNLILPVIILAAMGPFVFILPVESGEKNGFALTIMLSLSVVMTMFSEFIPTTATHVCFLSVYLLITFIICSLETIVTVITCRIHDFHNKGYRPGTVNQGFLRILAKVTFYSRSESVEDEHNSEKARSVEVKPTKVVPEKRIVWDDAEKLENNDVIENSNDVISYTYEEYAVLLDRFYFGLFSVVNIAVILAFMLYISSADGFK